MVVQKQEHEHVRLLDHVIPVNAVIRPVMVQRKLLHRNGADVQVRQVKKAVMLFVDAGFFVFRNPHPVRHAPPLCQLLFP